MCTWRSSDIVRRGGDYAFARCNEATIAPSFEWHRRLAVFFLEKNNQNFSTCTLIYIKVMCAVAENDGPQSGQVTLFAFKLLAGSRMSALGP